jgi:hypothetical protein
MKCLTNEKGVSLVEIIAGIPLAVLLFGVLILSMTHFIRVYQETKLYIQLQEDLYNLIETIRYGYANDDYNAGEGLIGLITARDVDISSNGRLMTVYPLLVEQNENFRCEYKVTDEHQVTLNLYYQNFMNDPKIIFPSTEPVFFGDEPQFQILNPNTAWTVLKRNEENVPTLIKIHLEAQVRFREREKKQSKTEDQRRNIRTITYETVIFVGNSET